MRKKYFFESKNPKTQYKMLCHPEIYCVSSIYLVIIATPFYFRWGNLVSKTLNNVSKIKKRKSSTNGVCIFLYLVPYYTLFSLFRLLSVYPKGLVQFWGIERTLNECVEWNICAKVRACERWLRSSGRKLMYINTYVKSISVFLEPQKQGKDEY